MKLVLSAINEAGVLFQIQPSIDMDNLKNSDSSEPISGEIKVAKMKLQEVMDRWKRDWTKNEKRRA